MDRVYRACYCDEGCLRTKDCCYDYPTECPGPGFITTMDLFGKGRRQHDITPLDPGFCMEYKMESLTPHCRVEKRPHAHWMQYLREGYVVCVACRPPAMRNHSGSCQGDGQESDSEELLHWQAVGNSRCRGTWKKVQRTAHCSCPHVHSFLFI
ncbi:somatomedin-B and thrombospondin type-1 domain-containing protein-like [Salvelinus alpinus]